MHCHDCNDVVEVEHGVGAEAGETRCVCCGALLALEWDLSDASVLH